MQPGNGAARRVCVTIQLLSKFLLFSLRWVGGFSGFLKNSNLGERLLWMIDWLTAISRKK